MEFEFIKEQIDIKPGHKTAIYADTIRKWLETDNKTLVFKCKNGKEAKSCESSARQFKKKNNLDFVIVQRSGKVYCVRA